MGGNGIIGSTENSLGKLIFSLSQFPPKYNINK